MLENSRFHQTLARLHRPAQSDGPPWWKISVLSVLLALLIPSLVLLATAIPLPWTSAQPPERWSAEKLGLGRGVGERSGNRILIRDTDPSGIAIVALSPASFRATDYRQITWQVKGLGPEVSAALLWRTDYKPGALPTAPLSAYGPEQLRAWVAGEKDWIGNISGLALLIKGKPTRPIEVLAVSASPRTAVETISETLSLWFRFEKWQGSHVNSVEAGAPPLPLPLFAALVAFCGIFVYTIATWTFRWRPQFVVYACLLGFAWLLGDARWLGRLGQQSQVTAASFAGKSLADKHLAGEDAPVFAFARRALEVLPKEPARVLVTAEEGALRGRLAYYLLPHQVYYTTYSGAMPAPSALRPGDFVVALSRRNFQFNPSQGLLRWDDFDPIKAELLLFDQGNAVLRVQ